MRGWVLAPYGKGIFLRSSCPSFLIGDSPGAHPIAAPEGLTSYLTRNRCFNIVFDKAGSGSGMAAHVFAAGEAFKEILAVKAQLFHAHFRGVIGGTDPALQVFKVLAKSGGR